jgi:hypothetical protein
MIKEEIIGKWELELHKSAGDFRNSCDDSDIDSENYYLGRMDAIEMFIYDLRKLNVKKKDIQRIIASTNNAQDASIKIMQLIDGK